MNTIDQVENKPLTRKAKIKILLNFNRHHDDLIAEESLLGDEESDTDRSN